MDLRTCLKPLTQTHIHNPIDDAACGKFSTCRNVNAAKSLHSETVLHRNQQFAAQNPVNYRICGGTGDESVYLHSSLLNVFSVRCSVSKPVSLTRSARIAVVVRGKRINWFFVRLGLLKL